MIAVARARVMTVRVYALRATLARIALFFFLANFVRTIVLYGDVVSTASAFAHHSGLALIAPSVPARVTAITTASVQTELAIALKDGLVLSAPLKSARTAVPTTVTALMARAIATWGMLVWIALAIRAPTRAQTMECATTANVSAIKASQARTARCVDAIRTAVAMGHATMEAAFAIPHGLGRHVISSLAPTIARQEGFARKLKGCASVYVRKAGLVQTAPSSRLANIRFSRWTVRL